MKINRIVSSVCLLLLISIFMVSCSEGQQNQEKEVAIEEQEVVSTPGTLAAEVEEVLPTGIDTDASKVHWSGEMMGMYTHEGTVDLKEANTQMKDGKITGGSFSVDLNTITPTDEMYNPEEGRTKEKLVGHLTSPDFFDVSNHPTATFEIESVNGSTAIGKLTVRGISHQEEITNILYDGETISGQLEFDRQKYEVAFTHPMKEMVISDQISLQIVLKAS